MAGGGYSPILTGSGKLLLSKWTDEEVYHIGLKRWFKRKPWFLKRKYLGWAIAQGLVVPPTLPFHRRKRRRGKHQSARHVRTLPCRFRDTNPNLEPVEGSSYRLPESPSDCGVIKTYTSGTVTNKKYFHYGGALQPSLYGKKTWDCLHPGPPYKDGGAFSSIEFKLPQSKPWPVFGVTNLGAAGTSTNSYKRLDIVFRDGNVWTGDTTSSYYLSSNPSVSGYDTLAWDKLKPRVSPGNLAQFLYELKDLPGQLETSANALWNSWRSFGGGYATTVMHPRSVADNFLNHEFGWVPFLSDLQKLFTLYTETEKYISNLVRLNNTWQRRRAVLEDVETETRIARFYGPSTDPVFGFDLNNMCNSFTVDGISCKGLTDIYLRNTERVWAVGSFKFYRPEFDDRMVNFSGQLMNIKRLMTLYGLRINPTLIWKLTPWTWAIDWFTQIGSFIQRVDDFTVDGIVSRYLYVMRTKHKFVTKNTMANFISGSRGCSWQRELTQKQRNVADSPYGFDRPWSQLTPTQWAILGAIGITRRSDGFVSRG